MAGKVKTKDFVRFLLAHGCKYKRTTASHDHYKCPNCWRTITIREKDKEVPLLHLQTNLRTMGKSVKDLYTWLEKNKK